jgi:recombination protein RecA
MAGKIEAAIRQNAGLIAEKILAGEREEDDSEAEGEE